MGRDWLYGGVDNDTLIGGPGNDSLYGEGGNDAISGDNGNDVLFGGAGPDGLCGGAGADRFLVQNGDSLTDQAAEDARIDFVNNVGRSWTDAEILQIDVGLALLQARTNNTRLLKLSNLGALCFERVASLGANIAADNDSGGRIRFADRAFDAPVWQTAIHEIGHNWDTYWDARGTNPFWSQFLALSGWTRTKPNRSGYTKTTRYGETWWRLTAAAFATDRSATNASSHPTEDFAESFRAYFAGTGASQIPAKNTLIDRFLARLST